MRKYDFLPPDFSSFPCIFMYVFIQTFIYFLLPTIVYVAHFFLCLLSFQLCRQSTFFSSLSLQCMLRKSGTHQTYRVRLFCPKNGKNRYIQYPVNCCRFKSKWDLKLAEPKLHDCPSYAPCCFGMFWNNFMCKNEEIKKTKKKY